MKIIYSKSELRHMEEILRSNAVSYFEGLEYENFYNKKKLFGYLEGILSNRRDKEYAGCLFLDARNRILAFEILASGGPNKVFYPPRDLVKRCFELDSNRVITCHNHPTGETEPTPGDIERETSMFYILEAMDIELVDSVIVGKPGDSVSFEERGHLPPNK